MRLHKESLNSEQGADTIKCANAAQSSAATLHCRQEARCTLHRTSQRCFMSQIYDCQWQDKEMSGIIFRCILLSLPPLSCVSYQSHLFITAEGFLSRVLPVPRLLLDVRLTSAT
jgi:hypothetical protein